MTIPEFRCGTTDAILKLAAKLHTPYGGWMLDWSYQIAKSNEIEKYITLYKEIIDEDEKFVLMEIIIQAIEEQNTPELLLKYLNVIKGFVRERFPYKQIYNLLLGKF